MELSHSPVNKQSLFSHLIQKKNKVIIQVIFFKLNQPKLTQPKLTQPKLT